MPATCVLFCPLPSCRACCARTSRLLLGSLSPHFSCPLAMSEISEVAPELPRNLACAISLKAKEMEGLKRLAALLHFACQLHPARCQTPCCQQHDCGGHSGPLGQRDARWQKLCQSGRQVRSAPEPHWQGCGPGPRLLDMIKAAAAPALHGGCIVPVTATAAVLLPPPCCCCWRRAALCCCQPLFQGRLHGKPRLSVVDVAISDGQVVGPASRPAGRQASKQASSVSGHRDQQGGRGTPRQAHPAASSGAGWAAGQLQSMLAMQCSRGRSSSPCSSYSNRHRCAQEMCQVPLCHTGS